MLLIDRKDLCRTEQSYGSALFEARHHDLDGLTLLAERPVEASRRLLRARKHLVDQSQPIVDQARRQDRFEIRADQGAYRVGQWRGWSRAGPADCSAVVDEADELTELRAQHRRDPRLG